MEKSHYFYPRPPRGGRPVWLAAADRHCAISIHALREEGDAARSTPSTLRTVFLSTPSARRATEAPQTVSILLMISIHALREEGDLHRLSPGSSERHFYPRPPRGGRLALCALDFLRNYFYPRPPRGGRPAAPTGAGRGQGFLSTPSARRATEPYPG